MKGLAQCAECDHVESFDVPKESRNPAQRRGVTAYLEDVRRTASRRHKRITACKSSRFNVIFVLAPKQLVAIAPIER